MCSCLFIIGDVLPFAGTTKKEDKEELFNTFIMLRKSAKICGSCSRNCMAPECVSYNFSNMIHIFLCTIFLNIYVNKLNKMNLYDLKSLSVYSN